MPVETLTVPAHQRFDDETDHGEKTEVNLDSTCDFDDFPARELTDAALLIRRP